LLQWKWRRRAPPMERPERLQFDRLSEASTAPPANAQKSRRSALRADRRKRCAPRVISILSASGAMIVFGVRTSGAAELSGRLCSLVHERAAMCLGARLPHTGVRPIGYRAAA